jgi:glycosidase
VALIKITELNMTKFYSTFPRIWLAIGTVLIALSLGGYNISHAATLTARAVGTDAPTMQPTSTVPVSTLGDNTAWFSDTVLYSVFVRSFRDSNGDGIGDLQGVIDGLDYIQSLGANTIWLLPVFKSPSYHGYDTTDYYTVNPDYGTNADLIRLIQAVHKRHMRILLDYVVNHTSDQHPYFKDALGNPASQYSDYYTWLDDGHTKYNTFAGVQNMPQLNYDSPKVRQFAIDIALYWLDPLKNGDLASGVDGFRCDVATGPPHDFWAQLRTAMTAKNPQSLLLGEIWLSNPKDIATYLQGDQFDAAFDFPLYGALGGNTDKDGDGALAGHTPNFAALYVRSGQKLYPSTAHIVRFVNNHDTNRVASDVMKDPLRERAAAVFDLTAPGTPMIYYGEELGMLGDKGGPPWYDAFRREPLPWAEAMNGAGQTNWFAPPDRWNKPNTGVSVEAETGKADSLLTLYQTLGKLRADHPSLRTGQYDLPTLSATQSNLYELRDWNDGELVVTIINFSTKPIDWSPTTEWAAGGKAYQSPAIPTLQQAAANAGSTWTIQPGGYLVFSTTP